MTHSVLLAADLPTIFQNRAIGAALVAWLVAQLIKFLIGWLRVRTLDFTYFVSTGGFPSAHSASVSAIAMSIGMASRFDSAIFALAMWFALIVMFDAQSVRRAAGDQARILNQLAEELMQHHHLSQKKLAELLGHTPVEVGAGMLLGIAVGWFIH